MRHKSLQMLLLAAASRADLRREKKEEVPCASTDYNGSQRIEKTRFAAGARGRVAYALCATSLRGLWSYNLRCEISLTHQSVLPAAAVPNPAQKVNKSALSQQ